MVNPNYSNPKEAYPSSSQPVNQDNTVENADQTEINSEGATTSKKQAQSPMDLLKSSTSEKSSSLNEGIDYEEIKSKIEEIRERNKEIDQLNEEINALYAAIGEVESLKNEAKKQTDTMALEIKNDPSLTPQQKQEQVTMVYENYAKIANECNSRSDSIQSEAMSLENELGILQSQVDEIAKEVQKRDKPH